MFFFFQIIFTFISGPSMSFYPDLSKFNPDRIGIKSELNLNKVSFQKIWIKSGKNLDKIRMKSELKPDKIWIKSEQNQDKRTWTALSI